MFRASVMVKASFTILECNETRLEWNMTTFQKFRVRVNVRISVTNMY